MLQHLHDVIGETKKVKYYTSSLCIKSLSGDGIYLVNEDDGRGIFLCQPEDVTHHTRALTQILLNKLRSHHTNERGWGQRDWTKMFFSIHCTYSLPIIHKMQYLL